jgi:thiol reductant ABC exporter CydD subunit
VGPLDPRLVRYARATRTFIALSVSLGLLGALLLLAQAWLIADVVARAFDGGLGPGDLREPLLALLLVVLARATLAWAAELTAHRCSASAKSQLRAALVARLPTLAAGAGRERGTGELAVLATRGLDALDGYFSLYLPQLLLAVIVPVVVVAAILADDWISAAIIAVTVPLIPLFMALIGAGTRDRVERELRSLERLAGHFLDVVAGLPTLKVFGRAKAQTASIREITDRHRRAAMATLRVTFLSSLTLELVATIAVALVAVAVGLRLMDGSMSLRTALFALVLAPEAFIPLRRLGASRHASAEGIAAAERVFAVLEAAPRPSRPRLRGAAPDPGASPIEVDRLTVTYPGRGEPALADLSLTISPGEVLAIAGPSGCGKSTLLSLLLGLLAPDSGAIRVGGVELDKLDIAAWRARLAWVPQRPHVFSGTVADNVRVGRRDASDREVRAALADARLEPTVSALSDGLDTVLGVGGAGLSAGERRRLALARAFVRRAPLLLLDEPTAGLDAFTELEVARSIRRLAHGRTVLIVSHRPAMMSVADRVVPLLSQELAA